MQKKRSKIIFQKSMQKKAEMQKKGHIGPILQGVTYNIQILQKPPYFWKESKIKLATFRPTQHPRTMFWLQ